MNFWAYLFAPLNTLFLIATVITWAISDLSMLGAMHAVLSYPAIPVIFLAAVAYAVFLTALDELADRQWPEPPK